MVQIHTKYTGQLHCELTHLPSGTKIGTDAPKDNEGRGELFSPTDLVGAALGSCVLTTIAIGAKRDGISIDGAEATVTKEMSPKPRRIASLNCQVRMPPGIPKNARAKLEAFGNACPVHRSLHPDIQAKLTFIYPD